jgi:hypothetical protein
VCCGVYRLGSAAPGTANCPDATPLHLPILVSGHEFDANSG